MIKIIQSVIVGMTMSFIEMRSHKLRSVLSMIGVMLGVGALVAMLTLVGGVQVFLNEKMSRWAGSIRFFTIPATEQKEKISWSRSPSLHFFHGDTIASSLPAVRTFYHSLEIEMESVVRGREEEVHVRGVDSVSFNEDMENCLIKEGRDFTDQDYLDGSRVCIISWLVEDRIAEQLRRANVQNRYLIGRSFIVKGTPFSIIGVFTAKDTNEAPWYLREGVYVPLRAMQRYITGINPQTRYIRVAVYDPNTMEQNATMISRLLTSLHRGVTDFDFRVAEWLEQIRAMITNASILMTAISFISLLVGGLSIMNVMLSSISERIYEIGIRQALGARRMHIFVQFLAETVTLSLTGGCIGSFLGMIPLFFKEEIKRSTEGAVEPTIFFSHLIFIVVLIVGIGILFGLYPALKASRMNPVEALRYE